MQEKLILWLTFNPGLALTGFRTTRRERNLLWLSRRLIITTVNTSTHTSTFPNAPTSKRAQNHEISIYFSTNSNIALCHADLHKPEINALVSMPNEARY